MMLGKASSRKATAHQPAGSQAWGACAFGVPERREHRRPQQGWPVCYLGLQCSRCKCGLGLNVDSALACCVALGKLLHLPGPHFLLYERIEVRMCMQCLALSFLGISHKLFLFK